jgi:hypothetical protein
VAFVVLSFAVNAGVRLPCHDICGSDIGRDYETYGINRYHLPFFDRDLEYPPLIGEVMLAGTVPFDHGFRWPFLVNALALTSLAALTTWMLWRRYGLRTRRWALSPPLIIEGLTNWDLLAVAPATIGLLEWEAGRTLLAGALFGAGTAAKLFPALYVPILAVSRATWRHAGRMITGFVLGLLALSLPVYAFAPHAFSYFLHYHANRTPSRDSILFFLFRSPAMNPWLPHVQEAHASTIIATVSLAVALVVLVAFTARRRLSPLAACALVTMAFMVTNKIYSPQYDLWLVPFFVMLPVRTKLVVHFYISSFAVWLLTAAAPSMLPTPWRLYLVALPVLYRLVVLAYLAREFVACSRADIQQAIEPVEVQRVGLQYRTRVPSQARLDGRVHPHPDRAARSGPRRQRVRESDRRTP